MTVNSSYIHSLEGRLRIKLPVVKGAAARALEVERHLQNLTGVQSVSANPTTGNVLILYNARLIDQWAIIAGLKELGYLPRSSSNTRGAQDSGASRGLVETVTSTVTASLMEVALTRLVASLI
jgi:copper chaperone CopZ